MLACHDYLGDFVRRIIADSEADKFLGFVQVVDGFESDGEGNGAVGGVEVEDVYGVGSELFEGDVDLLRQILWTMSLWLGRVEFGSQSQALETLVDS